MEEQPSGFKAFAEGNYNMAVKIFSQQKRNNTRKNNFALLNNIAVSQFEIDKNLNGLAGSLTDILRDKSIAKESICLQCFLQILFVFVFMLLRVQPL